MYNFEGGLGLSSAYALIYTLVVLTFVGIAFLVLGTKSDKVDIKLSSIQKRNFEMIKQKREEKKEVINNG